MDPHNKQSARGFFSPLNNVFIGLIVLIGSGLLIDWYSAHPTESLEKATYVGRTTCAECHAVQHQQWLGSHHDQAMQTASAQTVLGNFNDTTFTWFDAHFHFFRQNGQFFVNAEGPNGQPDDYLIKYTFGVDPLQQYMVEFDDGRVQVLNVAWDTERRKWFFLPPPDAPDEPIHAGDPMHWTGMAQNWNTMCADCHSTNLQKQYDLESDSYHTTFSEIDVSCEACHGPGSLHVELSQSWSLFWDRRVKYGLACLKGKQSKTEIETCATCHSRRSTTQVGFRPGKPFHDYFQPQLLHDGLYHANGQILDEVYVYGSFLQSKMHHKGIRCTDCHNPHSLQLKYEGNRLCGQCHIPGRYDTPAHHHHAPDERGSQCVECHMPERTYMVVDPRHDHSFRIPRPDLSVEFGTPNACNDCHIKEAETADWADQTIRKWYGDQRRGDPHWTAALAAGRKGQPQAIDLLKDVIQRQETPNIVRATATDLLASLPGKQTLTTLQQLLHDDDPWVSTAAARGLSLVRPHSFQHSLTPLLRDKRRPVRLAAATRLLDLPRTHLDWQEQRLLEHVLEEYRDTHRIHLDRASSHLNLGGLERQLGNLNLAKRHYQTAIQLEPYLTGPRSELASVLETLGTGNPEEIQTLRREELANLQRDSQLLPDHAPTFYRLGLSYYLADDLDKAEIALRKAASLAPHSYDMLLALALLLERQQKWNDAIQTLRQMKHLRPEDPAVRQIYQRIQSQAKPPSSHRK